MTATINSSHDEVIQLLESSTVNLSPVVVEKFKRRAVTGRTLFNMRRHLDFNIDDFTACLRNDMNIVNAFEINDVIEMLRSLPPPENQLVQSNRDSKIRNRALYKSLKQKDAPPLTAELFERLSDYIKTVTWQDLWYRRDDVMFSMCTILGRSLEIGDTLSERREKVKSIRFRCKCMECKSKKKMENKFRFEFMLKFPAEENSVTKAVCNRTRLFDEKFRCSRSF